MNSLERSRRARQTQQRRPGKARRTRTTGKPHVDFIELHILCHAAEAPVYGLWMIEELARHGYTLNASQLYPKFHRLEQQGALTHTARIVDGRVRKYYRITRSGQAYFREQKRRLLELISEALTAEELDAALKKRKEHDRRKKLKVAS